MPGCFGRDLKVSVIARFEFELIYLVAAVQHISYEAAGSLSNSAG